MTLSVNLENHYNYTLLEVVGDINASTAPILGRALDIAIEEGNHHLVLDCSQLYTMTSAGLKVLLSRQRKLSEFHHIVMCHVSAPVTALLEISGMTRFITINADIHETEALLMEADYATGHLNRSMQ